MIKKIVIGGAAAALLVAGTASASSLGDINDSTLAAGGFTLENCQAGPGGADIAFGTSQAADASIQPVTAFVSSMTVSNLENCEGSTVEGQLVKTVNGKDKMMGFFASPATVENGSITVDFPANKYSAEDVTGGLLIFKN